MGRKPKVNINEDTGEVEKQLNYSNYSLPVSEQETITSCMRDQDFAIVYTSDTTMITKFDKLCKNSPEYYSLIERNKYGNRYKIADKTLVSYRQKKKEMSEENKNAASERFKKLHAEGKVGRKKKVQEEIS